MDDEDEGEQIRRDTRIWLYTQEELHKYMNYMTLSTSCMFVGLIILCIIGAIKGGHITLFCPLVLLSGATINFLINKKTSRIIANRNDFYNENRRKGKVPIKYII